MFSLFLAIWVILLMALFVSSVDYNSEKSLIKTVLSDFECRVGVGLWFLLAVMWILPLCFAMMHDFQTGGNKWVGTLVVLLMPIGTFIISWVGSLIYKAHGHTES